MRIPSGDQDSACTLGLQYWEVLSLKCPRYTKTVSPRATVRSSTPSSVATAVNIPSGDMALLSLVVITSETSLLFSSVGAVKVATVRPLPASQTRPLPSSLREVICLPSGDQLTATIGLRCSR